MNLVALTEAAIPIFAGGFVTVVGYTGRFPGERWQAIRRARILGPVLLLFGAFILAKGSLANDSEGLRNIAEQINKRVGAPVMVDSDTRLERVEAAGEAELAYVLTLVNTPSSSSQLTRLVADLDRMLDEASCRNPDWLTFLESGVAIRTTYMTSDNKEAVSKVVRPADCGY